MKTVEKEDKKAHRLCAKDAKTVHDHAKCVAMLLDTPPGKNDTPVVKKILATKRGTIKTLNKIFCVHTSFKGSTELAHVLRG